MEMFKVENEHGERYWFCRPCTKDAYLTLDSKIYKNQGERKLMKDMRKFLNETSN